MLTLATIGALAPLLLFVWLLSAIACSYLAARKGFAETAGLSTGLVLSAVGVLVWLLLPARAGSAWRAGARWPWQAVAD
jgi:hypothetical protein